MGSLPAEAELHADVRVVTPSDEERHTGIFSPLSMTRVLEALHQDGLVVLRGVVDVAHIDTLNAKMRADADERLAGKIEFNHDVKSNFLQRPPIDDEAYLFDDVYFNPFVIQVANAYLGHRPAWNWLTSNTAVANTAGLRQPAHKDSSFKHPLCPYYFIANVPLTDFTVENGATEFWLGSHAHTTWRDHVIATDQATLGQYNRLNDPMPRVSDEALAARRLIRPPVQPAARRGDIMIRDLRTWHAGMPNTSDQHRIMLGLGYQSPHHPNYAMRLHLPAAQQAFFVGRAPDTLDVRANFYSPEAMQDLTLDTYFELRPTYLE